MLMSYATTAREEKTILLCHTTVIRAISDFSRPDSDPTKPHGVVAGFSALTATATMVHLLFFIYLGISYGGIQENTNGLEHRKHDQAHEDPRPRRRPIVGFSGTRPVWLAAGDAEDARRKLLLRRPRKLAPHRHEP